MKKLSGYQRGAIVCYEQREQREEGAAYYGPFGGEGRFFLHWQAAESTYLFISPEANSLDLILKGTV